MRAREGVPNEGPSDSEAFSGDSVDTVLVVDDDAAVLNVASKVLARGGYVVISASNGHEALEKAADFDGDLALLLSDIVMPGMGGRELGEAFAALYPGVPVLFMSAYTEDEMILQGVRFAEISFIAKPFTVEGLRSKVSDVIAEAKG